MRRIVDVVGSSALIMLMLPVLVGIAALIKFTSRGPILVEQVVPRRDETGVFGIKRLRFRTSLIGRRPFPTSWSVLEADPTPVGRWLRRFSLNELPQLLYVLRGETSLWEIGLVPSGFLSPRGASITVLLAWERILPSRIAIEDLGDFAEVVNRNVQAGYCWKAWGSVVSAVFWTGLNALGYAIKQVRNGKKSA